MARVTNCDSQLSQSGLCWGAEAFTRPLGELERLAHGGDPPRGTRVAYRYSPESSARPERLHATCPNIADLQFITDEKNFHAFQKEIDPDRG